MAVWLIWRSALHRSGRPSLWLSGFSNCQLDNPRDLTLQAGKVNYENDGSGPVISLPPQCEVASEKKLERKPDRNVCRH